MLALSREENPTAFQKTLGVNDFYFGGEDFEYPLGNIQMIGKSQGPMFRDESPGKRSRPGWTLDAWPGTRSTSGPRQRTCPTRKPGHGRRRRQHPLGYTPNNRSRKGGCWEKLKSMLGHLDCIRHLIHSLSI